MRNLSLETKHKKSAHETLMFAKTQTRMKIIFKHEWFHPTFKIKIIYE